MCKYYLSDVLMPEKKADVEGEQVCIFSGLARTEERVARLRRELERYHHVNIQSHSY